jgi:hypothetical protein
MKTNCCSFLGVALLATLGASGCESLGIKAHVTSWKTKDGHTEVKERDVENWDEFKEAMGEVGTDFSEVAGEMAAKTSEIVTKITDAPPPGEVKLGEISPTLARWQGQKNFDFLMMARSKKDAKYDFRYVRIGEPAYDDFFKAAAEAYGLSFMRRETARRMRKLAAAILDVDESKLSSVEPKLAAEKALESEGASETEAGTYLAELSKLDSALNDNPLLTASRVSELVSTGQKLAAAAPSSITNPKVLLHVGLVVEGIEQSVRLIKDAAAADD